jgi:hypothetical protein
LASQGRQAEGSGAAFDPSPPQRPQPDSNRSTAWQEARACLQHRMRAHSGETHAWTCIRCLKVQKQHADSDVPQTYSSCASNAGQPLRFCLQGPGQAVYVPPLWHHQVINLGCEPQGAEVAPDMTAWNEVGVHGSTHNGGEINAVLSINHNWAGGAHLPALWEFLVRETEAVRAAIYDCAPSVRIIGPDPFMTAPDPAVAISAAAIALQTQTWAEWHTLVDTVTAANCALGLADFGSVLLYRVRTVCDWLDLHPDSQASSSCASGPMLPNMCASDTPLPHSKQQTGLSHDEAYTPAALGRMGRDAMLASLEGLCDAIRGLSAHPFTRVRRHTQGLKTSQSGNEAAPDRISEHARTTPVLALSETPMMWTKESLDGAIHQVQAWVHNLGGSLE